MATSQPRPTTVASTTTCPRCLGGVRHTAVEHYCPECGLVVEECPIDHGPDWGLGDDEADPERAAPGNRNHHDRGLGSHYRRTQGDRDADRRSLINRHTRLGSTKERNRGYVTGEIHRMAGALDLPETVGERAKFIFRQLHGETLEGRDLDVIAPACLYGACRERGMGRTPDEVAAVARCDERDVRRRAWWVADEVGLELPPPDTRQRLRVVASRLPGDETAVSRATARLDAMDGGVVASGAPSTLAAALLYEAGDWTQAQVAEAAGVTPTGLRKRRDAL